MQQRLLWSVLQGAVESAGPKHPVYALYRTQVPFDFRHMWSNVEFPVSAAQPNLISHFDKGKRQMRYGKGYYQIAAFGYELTGPVIRQRVFVALWNEPNRGGVREKIYRFHSKSVEYETTRSKPFPCTLTNDSLSFGYLSTEGNLTICMNKSEYESSSGSSPLHVQ